MINKKTVIFVAVFLAGVAFAGPVRQLPLLNKLPSF